MSGREQILSRVRSRLGAKADDAKRRTALEKRLREHERHLLPQRVQGKSADELIASFRRFLEGQSATVLQVAAPDRVPAAIADYLRGNNLPPRVRTGSDELLSRLPWADTPNLEVAKGPAAPEDETGLSHAVAGVAETGTLFLASGPDNPVTLNFVPPTHIVVVSERDILPGYEDAWDRIRRRYGEAAMPRTVNLISGPSRTADVGGRLVMGAHGPKRLCVVIVKEA
jgi:L-lactate dehydrogenase complex protein LldG